MLEIVYRHTDFYIFNKPAGMSFHSETQAGFVVLAEQLCQEKLYSVHRLDKLTSGLLILARSSAAAARFTEMFSQKLINKVYLALSDQKPKKKQGWIKGDMVKARRGAYKLMTSLENPAITRFYSISVSPGLRGYLLKPFSGKTHQLRVALKSISAPILGDELYGGTKADRTYLHAMALWFDWHGTHIKVFLAPTFGEQYLTAQCQTVTAEWSQPWSLDW